jgi:hypothetical protein
MIGALLVGSTFLILILVAVLYLAMSIKTWANTKDEELKEMNKRIDETQSLFKKEITSVLKNINKILPDKNDEV